MKFSHGFTLTELLIAVAVIALLAALIAPVAIAVRARAKDAKARAEMRDEAIGWYAGDGMYLPEHVTQRAGDTFYQTNPYVRMSSNFWSTRTSLYDSPFDRRD